MNSRTKKTIIALGLVAVVVVVCVLAVFGFLVGAAVAGYRSATRAGNEAVAIQNLKTIAAFEGRYFYTHNRTFGTFEQLARAQMLSPKFTRPAKLAEFSRDSRVADGFLLTLTLAPKPDGSPWFKITADPQNDDTGTKHFYLDSDDQRIRVNPDRQAGPTDPFDKDDS